MAEKPKTARKKPGPKPKPPEQRKGTKANAITIRGSAKWYDWLKRLAAKHGLKPTPFLCMLLSEKAAEVGFEDQPPRL